MFWTLELASSLDDAPWPASKDELIDYANRSGAPEEVIENLQELERRFHEAEPAKPAEPVISAGKQDFLTKKTISKEERKIKNRISFLEKEIESTEGKMKKIEAILANPGKDDDVMELTRTYLEHKRDLDAMTEEWAELSEQIDQ